MYRLMIQLNAVLTTELHVSKNHLQMDDLQGRLDEWIVAHELFLRPEVVVYSYDQC